MIKRKNKANYKKTNHVYLTVTSGFTVKTFRGRRGRGRMVDGFATTYTISAYHY